MSLILWFFVTFLGIFFFYKVFFRPLSYMWSHIKRGEAFYYFPIMGIFFRNHLDVKAKSAFYAYVIEKRRLKPTPRLIATNVGSSAMLILLDTKLIKAFYASNDLYRKKLEIYGFLPDLLGQGLITANGSIHKRHRKITSRVFHWEFLTTTVPMIVKTTKEIFDELDANKSFELVKITEQCQAITGIVVGRIFFGEEMNNYKFKGQQLTVALGILLQRVGIIGLSGFNFFLGDKVLKKIPFGPQVKLMKDIEDFRNMCMEIVQEKKKLYKNKKEGNFATNKEEWRDMMNVLFEHVELYKDEEHFNDKDIVDEFITFFLAGMDTTAHLVSMSLYYFTQHPQYLARARQEADKFYKNGKNLTLEDLQKMDFIMAFLKETLRIANPAPLIFPREALQDHYLEDVKIEKGTTVTVGIIGNHFSDDFFEDPDRFYPERWLDNSAPKDVYAYIPFSGGARNCIGQHLSLIEARIIVAEFIKRYNFTLKEGYKLRMTVRFMHEPEEELKLNLTRIEETH